MDIHIQTRRKMMIRVMINREQWLKLIRGETVEEGKIQITLSDIGFTIMKADLLSAELEMKKSNS
jgi:hypothetical protein